jgi:hypothetical protein
MTGSPTIASRIDVDPPAWIVVPGPDEVSDAWRAEVLDLFAAVEEIDRSAEGEDRLFAGGPPVDPAAALEELLAFRAALEPEERLVASLLVPNRWPLPVVVTVGPAGPDAPDLLQLAGAEGGLPVDRPAVEELPEDARGEGPVVTRYDLDDEGVLWATVCAVRRERAADGTDVDTRVLWRTRDLDVVPVFGPEVVALVGRIENTAEIEAEAARTESEVRA